MATKIEWTNEVWQPIVGCTKCSLGCLNCYAEKMACRLAHIEESKKLFKPKYSRVTINNKWAGNIYCDELALDKPFYWRKPRRIFVCSMGDLFHEKVPFDFIDKVFLIMEECPYHTFLLLTKRPKRALSYYKRYAENIEAGISEFFWSDNIYLGVSISTQAEADEKIPILLQIPAAVRFISVEPMLSGVDLDSPEADGLHALGCGEENCSCGDRGIDWVIIGAESIGGRPGRECKLEWVQDLVSQCKAANVPVFVKQLHIDGKLVKDITKFPKDLRAREYPKGGAK